MVSRASADRRAPAPLTQLRSAVVISDEVCGELDGDEPLPHAEGARSHWRTVPASVRPWDATPAFTSDVAGGYLERLPLSLLRAGFVDKAEIWRHWHGAAPPPFDRETPVLARRAFRLDSERAPFASREMAEFISTFGAPHILVVLGLGVAAEILELCANSIIIYNSIDAPALRVPANIGGHFDLVLTGAQWQSDEVNKRHPGVATAVMPIGPEFAAPEQFRPLGHPKDLDLIYVAAAQPYKRHDILFNALARLPRDVRALCLFGYGEQAEELRRRAADEALSIEFVGPPGVPFEEVNRLMNRARFGVVCGVDDGAPAILTEYMLAGLPVVANADLACGLQFITPETGIAASAERFADAIMDMRERYACLDPRQIALERWTWPHTVARLNALVSLQCNVKRGRALDTR